MFSRLAMVALPAVASVLCGFVQRTDAQPDAWLHIDETTHYYEVVDAGAPISWAQADAQARARGALVSDERVSYTAREVEVMLDRGSRFRVVSTKRREGDDHRRLVILEEIDPA